MHTSFPTRENVKFDRYPGASGGVPMLFEANCGLVARHEKMREMSSLSLSELLRLPSEERAELALVLWESLSDAERHDELALTPQQEAELDRRWTEHLANPESAIPWEEVRRKLQGRE